MEPTNPFDPQPSTSGTSYSGGNVQLQQTQQQVNEVVEIMRSNVEKVIERDAKVNELAMRAEVLNETGLQFQQQTVRLKNKYWWQNAKLMMILGGIAAIFFIVIIVYLATGN